MENYSNVDVVDLLSIM